MLFANTQDSIVTLDEYIYNEYDPSVSIKLLLTTDPLTEFCSVTRPHRIKVTPLIATCATLEKLTGSDDWLLHSIVAFAEAINAKYAPPDF